MVIDTLFARVVPVGQVLAQGADRKIPEPTRTIILMALLGIVLVGMMLIVATMLGAHWVRRQGRHRRGPVVPKDVITPRVAPPARSSTNDVTGDVSSAETFIGDDTVRGDDTVVG